MQVDLMRLYLLRVVRMRDTQVMTPTSLVQADLNERGSCPHDSNMTVILMTAILVMVSFVQSASPENLVRALRKSFSGLIARSVENGATHSVCLAATSSLASSCMRVVFKLTFLYFVCLTFLYLSLQSELADN